MLFRTIYVQNQNLTFNPQLKCTPQTECRCSPISEDDCIPSTDIISARIHHTGSVQPLLTPTVPMLHTCRPPLRPSPNCQFPLKGNTSIVTPSSPNPRRHIPTKNAPILNIGHELRAMNLSCNYATPVIPPPLWGAHTPTAPLLNMDMRCAR